MPVRAVLFDLDGTLWGSAPWWRDDERDWARISSRQAGRLAPLFGEWRVDLLTAAGLVERFWPWADARDKQDAAALKAASGPSLVLDFLQTVGVTMDGEQADLVWAALDLPAHEFGRQPFDDSVRTLARLKGLGLAVAVVTNRWSDARKLFGDLREFGLGGVDVAITSADVGFRKPHRMMFSRALQSVGCRAEDAVMVGDHLENDVRGARAVGIRAVLKLNGRQAAPEEREESDCTINDLEELLALPCFT